MGRRKSRARQMIKDRSRLRIEVYIPYRPWRPLNDIRPGMIVAEGRVMVG